MMEDNDFCGLARDLERARQRKEEAAKEMCPDLCACDPLECSPRPDRICRRPAHERPAQPNPPNPKQRYGDLKVPLGLVPSAAKIYMALALAEGAAKYGFFNWRDKAVEAMTYIHALERHVSAWVDGEDTDPISGKPHLGHAMACLAILADATEVGNLIDNRPLPAPTGELLEDFAAGYITDDDLAGGCMGDDYGPLTAPKDWWTHYTPAPPKSKDNPYIGSSFDGFMAEIMETEKRQNAAFGEGDETDAKGPSIFRHPGAQCPCNGTGVIGGVVAKCLCNGDGGANPVPTPKWDAMDPARCVNFGKDNPIFNDVLKIDPFDDMHPCNCDRGRCKIENGRVIGSRVFCCAAEEGR